MAFKAENRLSKFLNLVAGGAGTGVNTQGGSFRRVQSGQKTEVKKRVKSGWRWPERFVRRLGRDERGFES